MFEGFQQHRTRHQRDGDLPAHQGAGAAARCCCTAIPQTHAIWHRVAPALAERFTVVCADLRGYGDSGKPRRRRDARRLRQAGHGAGHGRGHGSAGLRPVHGGRPRPRRPRRASACASTTRSGSRGPPCSTSCRPARCSRATNQALATGYYHWFFLIQPEPLAGAADRRRPDVLPAPQARRSGRRPRI